jgi:peptidoglycan-N-acetylglucosamine deacetylase
MDRRSFIRRSLLVAGGAALGAGALQVPRLLPAGHLPLAGGYAPAADRPGDDLTGNTSITWHVQTDEPVVAFTFDDGPGPKWTSYVLDALEHYDVPATFFLVGEHLQAHADLLRGRLDRHAVGNHSWSHPDLGRLDAVSVEKQLTRAHETIHTMTGRTPELFRPPYGHLGGSTLMAADKFGYHLVLWSQWMDEAAFRKDPAVEVDDLVRSVRPGQIILSHDVGAAANLEALSQLGAIFTGLRQRGFRFVTVPELLALGAPPAARA